MAAARKLVLTRLVDFSVIVAMVTSWTPTTRRVSVSQKLCNVVVFAVYPHRAGVTSQKIVGVLLVISEKKHIKNMFQNRVL